MRTTTSSDRDVPDRGAAVAREWPRPCDGAPGGSATSGGTPAGAAPAIKARTSPQVMTEAAADRPRAERSGGLLEGGGPVGFRKEAATKAARPTNSARRTGAVRMKDSVTDGGAGTAGGGDGGAEGAGPEGGVPKGAGRKGLRREGSGSEGGVRGGDAREPGTRQPGTRQSGSRKSGTRKSGTSKSGARKAAGSEEAAVRGGGARKPRTRKSAAPVEPGTEPVTRKSGVSEAPTTRETVTQQNPTQSSVQHPAPPEAPGSDPTPTPINPVPGTVSAALPEVPDPPAAPPAGGPRRERRGPASRDQRGGQGAREGRGGRVRRGWRDRCDARDSVRRSSLPGNPRAAAAARQFVRAVLADWLVRSLPGADTIGDRLADEAVLLVSELVTNVVVHAGTTVELLCRLETEPTPDGGRAAVVIEVSDHHPARAVRARQESSVDETRGHGLQLVGAVADCWGITYRRDLKTVWFRLLAGAHDRVYGPSARFSQDDPDLQRDLRAAELLAPAPVRRSPARRSDADWINHGALSFLAEASDLLSGQLDEEQVALLAAQLVVPRLADWCAVWLYDGGSRDSSGAPPRLARVWHSSEGRIDALRMALEKDPPVLPVPGPQRDGAGAAVPWPWPQEPSGYGPGGAALACRLLAGGRDQGALLIGRAGLMRFPDEVVGLIEDLTRRVARAVATARAYRNQERISQVLQRRLLPRGPATVPGLESSVVYEPREGAWAGGDFWDLFDAGDGRWCFALGDVCGSGPEAAAVTGLARPVLRLLARDGYGVGEVLDRLNKTMAREATDSVAAVAAAVAAAGSGPDAAVELRAEAEQTRFLSLLYGEIVPHTDGTAGARCTLASAGHPLPLVLGTGGGVRVAAAPQMLLGVVEDTSYESESFDLAPGETLLCVTDGVTERRCGHRLFDDDDGLAGHLTACTGLGATAVAEHIRRAVHAFAATPPDDDLALLVLQATERR